MAAKTGGRRKPEARHLKKRIVATSRKKLGIQFREKVNNPKCAAKRACTSSEPAVQGAKPPDGVSGVSPDPHYTHLTNGTRECAAVGGKVEVVTSE